MAARREQKLLDDAGEYTAQLLRKHFFISRWQDDAMFAWYIHTKIQTLVELVKKMQEPNFYGNKLVTERDYNNEAYGFKIYNNREELVLTCKSRFNRLPSKFSWVLMDSNANMNTGKHFGPKKLPQAEAMGLMYRVIDMNNAPRPLMINLIIRLVAEFKLQGLSTPSVVTCLKHAVQITIDAIPGTIVKLANMPAAECELIAVGFDQLVRDMDKIEVDVQKMRNP